MTYKNTKTILFASLFAIMTIALTNNIAYADTPEDVENLTIRGTQVIEKLHQLEAKDPTQETEKKIAKLTQELSAIKLLLSEQGVYTQDEFQKQKVAKINSFQIADECSTCDQELLFHSGFDWRMNTYWYGSTYDPITYVLTSTGQGAVSTAYQTPYWGTDWSWPFTLAFVNNVSTAEITVDYIVTNGQSIVYNPDAHTETVTGTSSDQDQFYELNWIAPGQANDQFQSEVTLNSIN